MLWSAEFRLPITFKISRDSDVRTGRVGRKIGGEIGNEYTHSSKQADRFQWLLETTLIAICFAIYAGQPCPDVNESHYLTKAKHFWDRSYCPGDLFLGSAFSHWLFYFSFGWLTKFMSLSSFAWTGRILTWSLMAFAWQRLSFAIVPLKFMSLVSALFFLLLNDRFHLAGEWIVGGFEAKGISYFFVVLALSHVVRGTWKYAWPLLGAASAFHVLVGGWSVMACLFASVAVQIRRGSNESRTLEFWKLRTHQWWIPLLIGALISLAGIIPPLVSDLSSTGFERQMAAEIYVSQRIAHHLNFDAFPTWHVARFVTMVMFWALLYVWLKSRLQDNPIVFHRKLEPLQDFATGALLISFVGLILSGLAENGNAMATAWLKFYWFRLSDFAVPASISLGSCFVVAYWLKLENDIFRRASSVVFGVCILLAAALLFAERHDLKIPNADVRSLPQYPDDEKKFRESWQNWKKVCTWVRENTAEDAIFLTPYQQQTFKWYAARTEVVSWKDIPQDASSILRWHQRLGEIQTPQQTSPFQLLVYTDEQLAKLAQKYQADYALIPQAVYDLASIESGSGPPKFKRVYPENDSATTWIILKF